MRPVRNTLELTTFLAEALKVAAGDTELPVAGAEIWTSWEALEPTARRRARRAISAGLEGAYLYLRLPGGATYTIGVDTLP